MHVAKRFLITAAALALCAAPAVAQSAGGGKMAVGVVGGLYTLGGDDFEGVDAGIHFEGTLRFTMSPQITIGVGGGYNMNSTDVEGVDMNVLRVLVQPRYTFRMAGDSKLAPWVAAQAEWHRYSSTISGIDVSATGFGFGGLVGVTYWTSPTLGLEASAGFHSISFGDAEADGQTAQGTEASGTAMGLQFGVVFKLGGR
jgi:opacity protein-like surface antigen